MALLKDVNKYSYYSFNYSGMRTTFMSNLVEHIHQNFFEISLILGNSISFGDFLHDIFDTEILLFKLRYNHPPFHSEVQHLQVVERVV